MQATTNNLIIGAGLAGCTLARRLEEKGQNFELIGSSEMPSAANAAAGIINPVTGRWMTKSWRFDDFAPVAGRFYRQIESEFSITIYHPLSELRFCLNADDAKRAGRRSRNPRYSNVLGAYRDPARDDQDCGPFKNNHGSFEIKGAAYVNLPRFVQTLRANYEISGSYRDEVFDYCSLKQSGERWKYGDKSYERVFFCEGTGIQKNPWFKCLPLTPAKGETLHCKCNSLKFPDKLYHHEKWLLPYPDGSFRIGATYAEDDLSEAPTSEAAHQLAQSFQEMMLQQHELSVIQHLAGLRPSTPDARPLLGAHPNHPSLYVFNGLGSKGASLAPTLSNELLDFILLGKPLDPETNILRFRATIT